MTHMKWDRKRTTPTAPQATADRVLEMEADRLLGESPDPTRQRLWKSSPRQRVVWRKNEQRRDRHD